MGDTDHEAASRRVYGRSAAEFASQVGTEVSDRFEAAFLADRGVDVRGIDIAPEMVEEARRAHPLLRFQVGSLTDVPVDDGSIQAAVCWYSIITTPPARLGAVWAELDRILLPGGPLLVAFQHGDNVAERRSRAYGTDADLTLHRHARADVAASLTAGGFEVVAEILRAASLPHETTPQAILWAKRRP